MKPQEFINKWLGWAKNKEEINDEILADLEAVNEALRIHDVVGQSEQLVCSRCNENEKQEANDPYCIDCKIEIETN